MKALSLSTSNPSMEKGSLRRISSISQRYERLFAYHHGGCFCPAGRDIRQNKAVDVITRNRPSAVRDHVHLEVTRWRVIPILKGPDGDTLAKRCIHARSAPALSGDVAN